VIVDVDAGDDVDTTSAAAVSLTLERADEAGVSLVFARMHRTLREDLERGEVDLSGRVYRQVESAVDAYRRGELKRSSPDAASVEDGT
jgi:hypothetical protein